jgi:hypothetical protein
MRQDPSGPGGLPPRWVVLAGSLAILYHLLAVVVPILDTPSGPWAGPMGRTAAEPPQFAQSLRGLTALHGRYLRLAHSYHFVTNRPGDVPAVRFEVRLKDAEGNSLGTLQFPDPQANPWVRHRQQLLATALAPDLPVEPPAGELLAAPGQKVPTVGIWALPDERKTPPAGSPWAAPADPSIQLWLQPVAQHLVPRTRPVMRPPEWSVLLARSYARYLCRAKGAASAEIVRRTQEPLSPQVLSDGGPAGPFSQDLVASFGEVSP